MIRRVLTQFGFWLFIFGLGGILESLLTFITNGDTPAFWTWIWRGIQTIELVVGLVLIQRDVVPEGARFWKASLPSESVSVGAAFILGGLNYLGAITADMLNRQSREGVLNFGVTLGLSYGIGILAIIIGVILMIRKAHKDETIKKITE